MTSSEMLNLWKVGFEVFASNSAPGFEDADIYLNLNRSQDLIIEELVLNKDWLRLQKLVTEDSTVPSTESGTNFRYRTLPSDYKYYINSYSLITRTAITSTGFISTKEIVSSEYIKNEDITSEQLDKFYTNVFNSNKIFKEPKACVKTNALYVVPDTYTTITAVGIRYIKERVEIGVGDCELDDSLHRLVVERAVDLAKKIIFIQEPQSSK